MPKTVFFYESTGNISHFLDSFMFSFDNIFNTFYCSTLKFQSLIYLNLPQSVKFLMQDAKQDSLRSSYFFFVEFFFKKRFQSLKKVMLVWLVINDIKVTA